MRQLVASNWYLEWEIHRNNPGLLGDIAAVLGMLTINIQTINGVEPCKRGMLIQTDDDEKINLLKSVLDALEDITVTALRKSTVMDTLAVRHGKYSVQDTREEKIFRFARDEIGLLVEFMGEIFKKNGHQLIGVRGMPRVGKTEAMIAASVSANKRWTLVSSTLLRQTARNQLAMNEWAGESVYIIDGVVSTLRGTNKHRKLMEKVLALEATKVIEHPDIFARETGGSLADFDYIIELRNHPDEEITYEVVNASISNFDIT
ncbi:hypothetical protein BEP19_07785 [Ammoniphilus oxalaticus]|uniref:DUF3388 domain-containing protein n=1 Tax=Ammoniphilus oxalaticus TaxID=66863 RepID=A0A419SJY8_9BACL|nr:DUF3388 domain-containing protein [Ammoniphilus oxalaticus]RKD24292.1 hypothetical protein BEP19_07785 [Ammoniphilus oxalaticus]